MSEFKIFYSWQSDLSANKTTRFIDDCLSGVCEILRDVSDIKPDRATQGTTGSPDITESIFGKIDECDLFIADLSIINDFPAIDENGNLTGNRKRTPNPNVLLETGYAAKVLGWDRIICLYNSEYGNPDDYPFDISHRRLTGFRFTQATREIECTRIKQIIAQTVTTFLFAGGVNRSGRAHYQVGGYDFESNRITQNVIPYNIYTGKYYTENRVRSLRKCEDLFEQIEKISIPKSTKLVDTTEQSENPMKRLRLTLGGAWIQKGIAEDDKETIRKLLKEYLEKEVSDEFFDLGALKSKTIIYNHSEDYDGTEDEKRKFDLIGELENELLSLQLVDLYARTFDDMLILSLAVRNDSNETDTSIRISIHIENESAECVQPDRNLINPEIRGEGECVGLEGIVYDEKLVEHFLKMNEDSYIRYEENAFYVPFDPTQLRMPIITPFGSQQEDSGAEDYEKELKVYIKKPEDDNGYQYEIDSLRANETIWMGPVMVLKKRNAEEKVKLKYSIISNRTNGDLEGKIEVES